MLASNNRDGCFSKQHKNGYSGKGCAAYEWSVPVCVHSFYFQVQYVDFTACNRKQTSIEQIWTVFKSLKKHIHIIIININNFILLEILYLF